MTQKELPARAANIQRAVASTTACTSATVESLRAFLLPAIKPTPQQKNFPAKVPSAKGKGSSSQPVKAAVVRAKKRPAVTILEVPGEQSDQIESQDRLVLATEVVNVTLKSLTDAIKNPPSDKVAQAKKKPLARSSSSSSLSNRVEAHSQTPLQPLCVNRLANSPSKQNRSRRSSSATSIKQTMDGLRAQAECARIGLATLRSLQCQKDPPSSLPYLQLESGMSALIGKMLALGFDDIALRELRILKRRLDVSRTAASSQNTAASAVFSKEEDRLDPKTETLAEMLRFRNTSARGQLLSLIITTQLQLLRILALRRDPSSTEDALQHLHFSVPHSPVNLILIQRQLESDALGSSDKVARQLESLTQALIALCPPVCSAEEDNTIASGKNICPDTAFRIQLLAFQVRATWWKISGHESDIAKEIVDPFCRSLSTYSRRSKLTKAERYDNIKGAFQVIKESVQDVKGFRKDLIFSTYQMLAEIAQESSQFSEAIGWIKEARKCVTASTPSRARLCSINCRLASLELRSLESDPSDEIAGLLREAAKSLEGDLHGESAELDELLLAVASLRRSAFSVLQDGHRSSKVEEISAQSALLHACSDIVLLCARFLVRYVGGSNSQGVYDKTTTRRDQRRRLAARFATSSIESVVAIARLSADSEAEVWKSVETGLQDCFKLASSMADSNTNENGATGKDNQASFFASISNAYWCRYLHLKRRATDVKSCKECLLLSIELVRNRPLNEKLAGSLPLKLENFGQLCEEMRDYKKAADSYEEALHVELDSGLLRTAMEAAATQSITKVLQQEGGLLPLSRKLSAYTRAALKAIDQGSRHQSFYDPSGFSASERGVLLEEQLGALLSTLKSQGATLTTYHALNDIGTSLLSIYEQNIFPVRRLRVIVRLLGSLLTAPQALGNNLIDQCLEESAKAATGNHFDVGLLRFLPHLTTCRCLLIAMRQKPPDIKDLELVLASWSKLVQGSVDWGSLQTQVSDIAEWLVYLEILSDYLAKLGLELYRVSALNITVTIYEAATPVQCSVLVTKLSELGLQHVRLGYSGLAGSVLHKAQRYLEASNIGGKVKLRWLLSYAEYALVNGNLKTCKKSLVQARDLFDGGTSMEKPDQTRSNYWSDLSQMTADAYYVCSLLAAAEGQSSKALLFARLCVKNCHRAWAILEQSQKRIDGVARKGAIESENDSLVDGMSELSISASTGNTSTAYSMLSGVAFWTLVPRIFRGLNHLSLLFSYNGLYPEVRYYLQQGQKIAKAAEAASLNSQATMLLGHYLIHNGNADDGILQMQRAEKLVSAFSRDRHYAQLQLFLAAHHIKQGEWKAGESAMSIAESTIHNLVTKSFVDSLVQRGLTVPGLEIDMNALTLQEANSLSPPQSRKRQAISKRPQSKSVAQRDRSKSPLEEAPAIEVIALHRMRDEIVRGRIYAKMSEVGLETADLMLSQTKAQSRGQQDIVLQALLASRMRFRQGLEHFISDPVFCVIPESTISCPAIKASNSGIHDKQNIASSPPKKRSATSSKSATGKTPARKPKPRSLSLAKDQTNFLRLAQDEISNVFRSATMSSSTAIVHEISDVLGKVLMVLSAVSSADSRPSISPGVLLYFLEVGRLISITRESLAIQVECKLPSGKGVYDWPKNDALEDAESVQMHDKLELSAFQAEYIDIIPQDWNVISMTLSQERDEILVSKIRSGQTPFILKLPLNRHNSLDQDEETFGYDQGKAELQDIINLANVSTHSAQDLSHKGAKTEWWEGRAKLDARLKDLLTNMETIWFGGFKAIFSQTPKDVALLSRFRQSFQNILDKHLPSRQKSGRGGQSSRVALDLHVLELFIGLGNPSDSNDLDEPLMDLMYFVVDILQFNGERNAYDEIDFDSIVIDIIDALRQYHQAVKNEQGNASEKHTILILDKRLHGFPWESLPCMKDHAVSRLPSLGCLRDRISQQRRNSTSTDGRIYVRRNNGASILNPGGDLPATQANFEEPVQDLSGWECVVQREPSEAEMKDYLESNDIFLYFGHGSGGQYIRSRTIKKLEKCAVALLMGCSSGALTEAGEFEPYGTPMNYMHAGCPAMLATLWDVTDKDIDRFSQTILEKWGLFEGRQPHASSSPVKKGAKQKGKGRAKDAEKVERYESKSLSLDQAVAQGRDSCILRYLNGAAPVVYGVPVYLS